ncbi:cysteine peptidase family C39 domain-containing protein [Desulfocurvibacter africanus]|uniref:cysteine peptidase family C39 domain-containing protein n=1 Tax=Desulfocurvibacter africanus TaxID=873 RepID=UPI00040A1008|nr:cysteine peptidase family C39 domain-containing protein [Desulfocurvibacter africanus]
MLPAGLLPAEEQVISGVPFHSQGVGECGPASLAGVLNFHGDPATPEEIAADVLRTNLRGSLTLDLALWPRSRGFTTRWYAGSVSDILDKTGQGLPLLVMLDQGFGPVSANHFVVLLGHAPDAIIINDGARGPGVRMDWSRFLSQWERAGFWTLLVEPAQAEQGDRQ